MGQNTNHIRPSHHDLKKQSQARLIFGVEYVLREVLRTGLGKRSIQCATQMHVSPIYFLLFSDSTAIMRRQHLSHFRTNLLRSTHLLLFLLCIIATKLIKASSSSSSVQNILIPRLRLLIDHMTLSTPPLRFPCIEFRTQQFPVPNVAAPRFLFSPYGRFSSRPQCRRV